MPKASFCRRRISVRKLDDHLLDNGIEIKSRRPAVLASAKMKSAKCGTSTTRTAGRDSFRAPAIAQLIEASSIVLPFQHACGATDLRTSKRTHKLVNASNWKHRKSQLTKNLASESATVQIDEFCRPTCGYDCERTRSKTQKNRRPSMHMTVEQLACQYGPRTPKAAGRDAFAVTGAPMTAIAEHLQIAAPA